jgi:tRNA(fMet)-specific endonuclease VapC
VNAKYLLDTNILSELVRRPRGRVARRLGREGESSVCTSIVVAAELRYGASKSGSNRLRRQVEQVLSVITVLPLEEPADEAYARLRHDLQGRGTPIGPNDLLIAAHALAAGLTVVTANDREFSRVPNLKVDNWLHHK